MHPYIPLTEEQENALIGSMLGDGHLAINGKAINASLMIGRAVKDKDYLQYEADIFANFAAPRYSEGVHYHCYVPKRDTPLQEGYDFATVASPTFTPFHKKWYKERIKIVPEDLELNGQIIAHWLADDGSVGYNKLPFRFEATFNTHGFTKTEVEFLASLLNKRYNEEFLVRPKHRNGKTWWIIRAYDSACRAMFTDIDPYFKMDRKRIWDKPESRFWNDPPERQRSMTNDLARRKKMIEEIIRDCERVKLADLCSLLGYTSKGNDGKLEYKTLNKLLMPHIKSGKVSKFYDKNDNNTCYLIINEKDNAT